MLFTVFACTVLLLSQGNAAPQDDEVITQEFMKENNEFMQEMKTWLSQITLSMKNDVAESAKQLKDMPSDLLQEGVSQLGDQHAMSMEHLSLLSAPSDCVSSGRRQLQRLHEENLESFITCKNLSAGAKDLIDMGFELAKLTTQFLLTADDVLNGFSGCPSWNVFKFAKCSFTWVKDTITDVYNSFKALTAFNKNMAALIIDLKNQFEFCLKDGKAAALLNHVAVTNQIINQCPPKQ